MALVILRSQSKRLRESNRKQVPIVGNKSNRLSKKSRKRSFLREIEEDFNDLKNL